MTRICFYKLFLINENKNTEYLNNDYANVVKFMKALSNSRHNRQKTQKRAERQKNLVFQKYQYKMQTSINLYKQNNDGTQIMREIQFRSCFKF